MNSKQINDALNLALKRARAKGLTDSEAIAEAMADDPELAPVLADREFMNAVFLRVCRGMILELAEAEGWGLT